MQDENFSSYFSSLSQSEQDFIKEYYKRTFEKKEVYTNSEERIIYQKLINDKTPFLVFQDEN
jgi:hypothetical protein